MKRWPLRPIGDLLERVVKPVKVEPAREYREIGIRSHCRGIFHKPPVTGQQLGSKRVYWIEPGCLTLNIVFAWEQAVAMTTLNEKGMIASHRFPMYRALKDGLLPEYAYLYFSSARGKYDLGIASPGGAGRNKTLGQEEFKRLEIPVPPIEDQQLAISATATWSRCIDKTASLIRAKRELKRALMQGLFSSEEDCEQQPLESIAKCASGGTPSTRIAEYWGGSIPWAQSGDIHQRVITSVPGRITRAGLANSSAKLFPPATVLIALAGQGKTRGSVAISQIELTTNQSLAGIFCDTQRCLPEFLYHNLSSRYKELRSLSKGDGGRGGLTLSLIRAILIPLPPLDRQRRLIQILDAADRELRLLEKKLLALHVQRDEIVRQFFKRP